MIWYSTKTLHLLSQIRVKERILSIYLVYPKPDIHNIFTPFLKFLIQLLNYYSSIPFVWPKSRCFQWQSINFVGKWPCSINAIHYMLNITQMERLIVRLKVNCRTNDWFGWVYYSIINLIDSYIQLSIIEKIFLNFKQKIYHSMSCEYLSSVQF